MKHLFAFLSAILLMSACSNGADDDNVIVDPDLHPIVTDTGKLLSVDGSRMHIAYSYDEQGRVTYAERFDTTWYVVKKIGEYKYDADRIYITFQEFAEMPNGEHDPHYSRDFCHYDTLFLVDGRVDSLAGFRPQSRQVGENCYFFKFRYNERSELVSIRNDNVKRYPYARYKAGEPWYTEIYLLEWQDGNILRRTTIDPIHRDTTSCTISYSSLTGTFVVSDPRNALPDFEPLMQTGYFGKRCKNLFEGLEAKSYTERREYVLDEQGKVSRMTSNVTFDDGVSQDYAYNIKWAVGN